MWYHVFCGYVCINSELKDKKKGFRVYDSVAKCNMSQNEEQEALRRESNTDTPQNEEQETLLREYNTDTPQKVNSDSLTGLRGLASLHIVLFHTLISSNLHVNVIGSFEMPVFFLLSGYSLALTYGRTKYESNTRSCCTSPIEGGEDKRVLFKTFNFYRNRFARTMPVYYISNFVLGLSAYFFAFGTRAFSNVNAMWMFVASVINSLFPVGMILPGMMMPMVAPGWAISTLWFFYIVFPFLLPRLQQHSDNACSKNIVALSWMQLFLTVALGVVFQFIRIPVFFPLEPFRGGYWGYWVSMGWGVSRLPVFLMGVVAGLRRLRHEENSDMLQQNQLANFINAFVPFRFGAKSKVENPEHKWSVLVNIISITHLFLIVASASLGVVNGAIPWFINWGMNTIAVYSQLVVIEGLTRDGGKSLLARVCRLKITQELGTASMSLYLIHEPLQKWVGYAIAKVRGESLVWYMDKIQMTPTTPLWGLLIVLVLSPFLAWLLTKWVEDPLRKALRAAQKT